MDQTSTEAVLKVFKRKVAQSLEDITLENSNLVAKLVDRIVKEKRNSLPDHISEQELDGALIRFEADIAQEREAMGGLLARLRMTHIAA